MAKIDYSNINTMGRNFSNDSGPETMKGYYLSNENCGSSLAFTMRDLRRVLGKENVKKLREQVKVLKTKITPDLTEFSHAVLTDQIVRLEAQILILMLVFIISEEELK